MNARALLIWLCLAVPVAGAVHRLDVRGSASGRSVGFELVEAQRAGIRFTNSVAPEHHLTNNILLNGSGVACGDVDGDGLVDLYFCRLEGGNRLFRNLGNLLFADVTTDSGTACDDLRSTGTALADLDGDGDLDLVVNSLGLGTRVLFNDGKGHFRASAQRDLNARQAGHSLAVADVNGDGALDIYIANYRLTTLRDQPDTRFRLRMLNGTPRIVSVNGQPFTDPELTNRFTIRVHPKTGQADSEEHGEPDTLLLNDGKGQFTPLSFTGGAFLDEDGRPLKLPLFDWGLSVMMRDLNGDGAPDIYVCNDFRSPDRIWLNDGQGHFRAIPTQAIRQTSMFSMGLDVADINRDGAFDIFVTDMLSLDHQRRLTQRAEMAADPIPPGDLLTRVQTSRNTLLLARGDGTFAEVAQFAGVQASEWSWTPVFLDVDLDGYEDLLVANGFERDGMNSDVANLLKVEKATRKLPPLEQLKLRARFPRLDTPNVAFRNLGNGRFASTGREWNFDQRGVSQGMAVADLDNDGDLDVVINNFNGPPFLLRNVTRAPRIAVKLRGLPPNTHGIGARIVVTGGPVAQSQEMICGGRYLSSDDAIRAFAAGSATNLLRVDVTWRSGRRTVVTGVPANTLCVADEASAMDAGPRIATSLPPALFEDVSARSLNHKHEEHGCEDLERQPLLPRSYAQLGPGIAWCDFDGDGRDELVLAGPHGRSIELFRTAEQPFARTQISLGGMAGEIGTVLSWPEAGRKAGLIVATSDYKGANGTSTVVIAREGAALPVLSLPCVIGALAAADIDGDNALDLFVGGRLAAGRFPDGVTSMILRQGSRGLTTDRLNVWTNLGLVSGATFTDLNGDGAPDLVLACEWGPLRVFENRRGRMVDVTDARKLSRFEGLWNGVAAGDFDGDGRMDLVAANWGENSKHEAVRTKPLRIYYGDFDGNSINEVVESYFDSLSGRYVPARRLDALQRGMPWLAQKFPTWLSLSTAGVDEVIGEHFNAARFLEVNWVSTTVFLNRGDHFDAVRLPDEAQYAPAFGIAVADFDGDGAEDIFLAQNFFGCTPDTSRSDAGRGLLLRGDGKGGFTAVPGQTSGITIYGEQRGAAVSDFDGDGRVDLAVAQNSAETKLYRNRAARPGVRIRLAGPPGNPDAVGAVLRLGDGKHWGAAREIHAGGGYWSQDSGVSVMARLGAQVQVTWPGGKQTTTVIPPNASEIVVAGDGTVARVR